MVNAVELASSFYGHSPTGARDLILVVVALLIVVIAFRIFRSGRRN
jgi:hypothetical protein